MSACLAKSPGKKEKKANEHRHRGKEKENQLINKGDTNDQSIRTSYRK